MAHFDQFPIISCQETNASSGSENNKKRPFPIILQLVFSKNRPLLSRMIGKRVSLHFYRKKQPGGKLMGCLSYDKTGFFKKQ